MESRALVGPTPAPADEGSVGRARHKVETTRNNRVELSSCGGVSHLTHAVVAASWRASRETSGPRSVGLLELAVPVPARDVAAPAPVPMVPVAPAAVVAPRPDGARRSSRHRVRVDYADSAAEAAFRASEAWAAEHNKL